MEQVQNRVEVITLEEEKGQRFTKRLEFQHEYPPTKIMWSPENS
jgi:hypothetical protein